MACFQCVSSVFTWTRTKSVFVFSRYSSSIAFDSLGSGKWGPAAAGKLIDVTRDALDPCLWWFGSISCCPAEGYGNGDQHRLLGWCGLGRNLLYFFITEVHGWQNKLGVSLGGWWLFSPNNISGLRRPKNVKFGTKVASSVRMMCAPRFLEKVF